MMRNLSEENTFRLNLSKRNAFFILVAIFLAEFLIMMIGQVAEIQDLWINAILDSLFLALLILPFIYFFLYRPLNLQIKDRLQAEEILKKNLQYLDFHINNSPLASIEWDPTFVVTRWAGQSEKIFGWSASEIVGKQLLDLNLIFEEDFLIVAETMKKLTSGVERIVVSVNRNYTKDGRVIHCEWYNSVLNDQNGKLHSVMSRVLDVTERKHAEEMLRKSEESLNEAQRIGKIGNWEWDMITGKINWSNGMFQVFDIDRDKFDGSANPLLNVIHPDDIERFTESMKSNLTSGNSPTLEYRVIHCDKSIHTILAEGRTYFDENGNPVRNIGIAQDITERTLEKEALVASEKRYRMMFQNLSAGFALHEIILDEYGTPYDYRFLEINPAFEAHTGLKSGDLIGKTVLEVLPNTKSYLIEIYGKVALTGESANFEHHSERFGKYFQVNAYSPEYAKFATTFIDITERKQADEEKRRVNEMQNQLLKHNTEIRENERALISREIHDQLGQSLTALKLDLNWLQANLKAGQDTLDKLSGMGEIINDTIKDVQRISAELRPGILDDLGIAAAIEWYAEEFEKRSGIKVELDLDEVDIPDEMTSLALFRVMQESLTNVIRHAQATIIKISLQEINEHIVLDVEDNGVGISIEKLKSMTSLGLIGMHDRVKQVNGTLDILCGNDTGTKIRICVPFEY